MRGLSSKDMVAISKREMRTENKLEDALAENAKLKAQNKAMYEALKEIYEAELNADIIRILSPWFEKVEAVLAAIDGEDKDE